MRLLFLILFFSQFAFSQQVTYELNKKLGSKLEVTLNDTLVLVKESSNDSIATGLDYFVGEIYYEIKSDYKQKYDTIIVFYDSTKKDTMMFSYYNGFKDNLFKEWYQDGKLKTITSTMLNINKSWYPNGQLRWDKVPNSDLFCFDFYYNIKNKTWFPNGNLHSEVTRIGEDTLIQILYFTSGTYDKYYYYVPGREEKGDGYEFPTIFFDPKYFRTEHLCKNGQLLWIENIFEILKNYKTYYCNGNIRSIYDFFDLEHGGSGKYFMYYENGVIKTIGQYSSYKKSFMWTSQIGKWKHFDENGRLTSIEIFDKYGNVKKTIKK
jgi:antitoxin component YwqK of YwqJK toxin-antitoxin module